MTYTYAICEVSQPTYDEIAEKLRAAGYGHAFHDEDGEVIDMHGIALRAASQTRVHDEDDEPGDWFVTSPTTASSYLGGGVTFLTENDAMRVARRLNDRREHGVTDWQASAVRYDGGDDG